MGCRLGLGRPDRAPQGAERGQGGRLGHLRGFFSRARGLRGPAGGVVAGARGAAASLSAEAGAGGSADSPASAAVPAKPARSQPDGDAVGGDDDARQRPEQRPA